MNLSRRAFVGGAAAFGVAVAAPKFAFAEPSAAEKQAEADAALQKLLKLNSDLDQKVKDYAAAVDAHDAATAKMDECQAKIDENNERIEDLQGKLGNRANNMYRDGQTTFLDVILGSNSFDDFMKNWDMLTRMNENDAKMVAETKELRADNEAQRDEYSKQEREAAYQMEEADKAVKEGTRSPSNSRPLTMRFPPRLRRCTIRNVRLRLLPKLRRLSSRFSRSPRLRLRIQTVTVAMAATATKAKAMAVEALPRRATARIITFRLQARSLILRAAKLVSRMNGAAALPTSASTALALRRGVGSRLRVSRLAVPMALSTLPPAGVGRFPRHSPVMFCGRAAMWAFARLRVAVPTFMLRSQVKRYASRAGRNSSARFVGSK